MQTCKSIATIGIDGRDAKASRDHQTPTVIAYTQQSHSVTLDTSNNTQLFRLQHVYYYQKQV